MKLWNKSVFVILVAFLKTFQLALLPLLLVVMFLRFSWLKLIHIPQVNIGAIGYICFLSKHPLVYFMTSSWISCLIYFVNLLCVHVSLWITMSTLETYIHESVNPSPWYPFYLFLFMHSYLVIVGLKLFLISILSLSWLCSKWYRGSEDSMFMHIVFKCKHYKLCTNLGELPYF
jgi:hypothetical protein